MIWLLSILACKEPAEHRPCDLEVLDASLDFGERVPGPAHTLDLEVFNQGGVQCLLGQADLDAGGVFSMGTWDQAVVRPGQTASLPVTFQTQTPGSHRGELVFASGGTHRVSLKAEAVGAVLELSLEELDFGLVDVGCPTRQGLTLSNTGNAPLTITGLEFSAAGSELSFEQDFDGINGPLPWSLAPQDQVEVALVYEPMDLYPDSGYLRIFSDDYASPETLFLVQGEGRITQAQTDTFEQPAGAAIDVLIALDRSDSMEEHTSTLEAGFVDFVTGLSGLDRDCHVAVVVADDGCILGDQPYLDSSLSLAEQQSLFDEQSCMGSASCPQAGNNTSRAFTLLQAALDNSNRGSGGCNEGFFREHAELHLVAISDGPESSVNPYSYYISLFQGLKSSDPLIHAVGGDYPSGCLNASAYTGAYEATVATGGSLISICAADFGLQLLGQLEREEPAYLAFELSQFPAASTLELRVDGIPSTEGWQYVPSTNTIDFEEGFVPAPGSVIQVSYVVQADCP